ncbi:hypothetical protein D3C72_1622610 [compost metagenome]
MHGGRASHAVGRTFDQGIEGQGRIEPVAEVAAAVDAINFGASAACCGGGSLVLGRMLLGIAPKAVAAVVLRVLLVATATAAGWAIGWAQAHARRGAAGVTCRWRAGAYRAHHGAHGGIALGDGQFDGDGLTIGFFQHGSQAAGILGADPVQLEPVGDIERDLGQVV